MKSSSFSPQDFVHLHLHSHYSVLDGLSKIPEIVSQVKKFGMKSVALTDHGTMSGIIEFYQECTKEGIKPIIGIEAYLAARGHLDKDVLDRQSTHIIILVKNEIGYQNLLQLASISYLNGFYYKPRIDKELLRKHSQGLIVLSGCLGGEISGALSNNNQAQAEKIASWYKKVFGNDFYLELQDHAHLQDVQARINKSLMALAKKLDIQLVLTSDSHYLIPEDHEAHEVLLSIQTRSFVDDPKRMTLAGWDLSLSDPKDIVSRWQDICPEALENTRRIAQSVDFELKFDQILLPKFKIENSELSNSQYLKRLVFVGLNVLYGGYKKEDAESLSDAELELRLKDEISRRALHELKVIEEMGFADYFLIVWDFCNWGKSRKISFGPGRGSVAGSIVAYALQITTVDPLKYNLLFERFLDSSRVSMPDIDIDIEDHRRDEIIQYVIDKYGEDRVSNIVTFGTMAARNAIRDVARVLKMSYAQADQLAKMLPPPISGRFLSLEESIAENQELKKVYEGDKEIRKVFDLAMRLEGTIRGHGVHAAGVVIAPDTITKFTPLEVSQKGIVTTQYSMKPIEDLGLLKLDFLGLSNLTIIRNALRIIKRVYAVDLDINNLDLADKKTYQLLAKADTAGVFQLSSSGIRQYLKLLQPVNFEDLAAMLALYRPGPLKAGLVDQFIECRHGRRDIKVPHPAFEPALKDTYGVLVYQEQLMRISRDVCGFSGPEADQLRKAVGKKIRALMKTMKEKFIEGGIAVSKVDRKVMESFWKDVIGYADYAFNRSHSVAYGLIAYQTAYLKAHFPSAFMAAVMTSSMNNLDSLKQIIHESEQSGIKILSPDINQSFAEFAVVNSGKSERKTPIRYGLAAIKGVSLKAVEEIVEDRTKSGVYSDLEDFVNRQNGNTYLNRKTLEGLVKVGTFDCLESRGKMVANLDILPDVLLAARRQIASQQASLLGRLEEDFKLDLLPRAPISPSAIEQLDWEKEFLGIYLSRHPLELYRETLNKLSLVRIADLKDTSKLKVNKIMRIGGLLESLKIKIAKISRRQMAIINFEDLSGQEEFVVAPQIFEDYKNLWVEGKILVLSVKIRLIDSNDNQLSQPQMTIEKAQELIVAN